jgi:hypothetical protein
MHRLKDMKKLLALSLLGAATLAGPAAAAIPHPARATDVVIRVETGGGFVALSANLSRLPSFTLYGDGTLLVPGAVPQISPGPAISPLLRRHLGERQVQLLLRRARGAGLLTPGTIDYGDMGSIGVADAPSTTVSLNAAGRHVVREAYALGITAGNGRLSRAQTAARLALSRFIAGLPGGPRGARYVPLRVAVYVTPARGQAQPGATTVAWPLEGDLATAGTPLSSGLDMRCITVAGPATRTLLATLRTANDASRWKARGGATGSYTLIARPLLPDERSCTSIS